MNSDPLSLWLGSRQFLNTIWMKENRFYGTPKKKRIRSLCSDWSEYKLESKVIKLDQES